MSSDRFDSDTALSYFVSTVTAREVAIKVAAGRLKLQDPPLMWLLGVADRYRLRELQIDARTVCTAAALSPIHRDPFDRVLVALAQGHALTMLSSERNIAKYDRVKTLW